MNTVAKVKQARTPQEAMLAIAEALDRIESQSKPGVDTWTAEWNLESLTLSPEPSTGARVELTGTPDTGVEVIIPVPSPDKYQARYQFAEQQLRLAEHLNDESADWADAYAKGGPMWLYLGNRDLVLSYPRDVRAAMVNDVLEDSPRDAEEMARDVLKYAGETGPGSPAMMVGEANVG